MEILKLHPEDMSQEAKAWTQVIVQQDNEAYIQNGKKKKCKKDNKVKLLE